MAPFKMSSNAPSVPVLLSWLTLIGLELNYDFRLFQLYFFSVSVTVLQLLFYDKFLMLLMIYNFLVVDMRMEANAEYRRTAMLAPQECGGCGKFITDR